MSFNRRGFFASFASLIPFGVKPDDRPLEPIPCLRPRGGVIDLVIDNKPMRCNVDETWGRIGTDRHAHVKLILTSVTPVDAD